MSNENLKLNDAFVPKAVSIKRKMAYLTDEEKIKDNNDALSKELSTNERSESITPYAESDASNSKYQKGLLPSLQRINSDAIEKSYESIKPKVKSISDVISHTIYKKNQKDTPPKGKQKIMIEKSHIKLIKHINEPTNKVSE